MKPEIQDVARAKTIKKLETLNGVGEEIAGALYDAGYRTPTQVRIAPDADLISIAGIGEHNLEKIRTKNTATTKRRVGRREIEWNSHIGGPVLTVEEAENDQEADVADADALPPNDADTTPDKERVSAPEPSAAKPVETKTEEQDAADKAKKK